MGWRFRKSIKVGKYFRINISKSGIGYSYGVRGARVTHSPNGRITTTVGIPGTGLSYSESYNPNKIAPKLTPSSEVTQSNDIGPTTEIESADIESFQPTDMKKLIKSIKRARSISKMGTAFAWLAIIVLLIGVSSKSSMQILFGATFAVAAIICKVLSSHAFAVKLDYEFDYYSKELNNRKISAWNSFFASKVVWQVTSVAQIYDGRRHAGASKSISKSSFKHSFRLPSYIKTNETALLLKLKKEELLLLPDKIIIFKGSSVGAISYDTVTIDTYTKRYIEDEAVPKDAIIVDYTWQYVNKNGTPDKRFSNNRRLPVCKYGYVYLSSPTGLNVELSCSDPNRIDDFKLIDKPVSANIQHEHTMSMADPESHLKSYAKASAVASHQTREIYNKAIFLSWAMHGYPVGHDYPQYFKYELNILNPRELHQELVDMNYLEECSPNEKLNTLKVADLKEILKKYSLPSTGTKSKLINSIVSSLNEDILFNETQHIKRLKITDNGQAFLDLNQGFVDLYRSRWDISLYEYEQVRKQGVANFEEAAEIVLTEKDNNSPNRSTKYYLAELYFRKNDYYQALNYYIQVMYYDYMNEYDISFAEYIIEKISSLSDYYNDAIVYECYQKCSTVKQHKSKDEFLKIIRGIAMPKNL